MRPFLAPPAAGPIAPSPTPSVSIVIPTYQAARFVGRAIESCLAQTTPSGEIIVSDDGSTDDLDAVVARYGDPVRLLRGPHTGPPGARNRGFRAASGELVANLDADDVLHPAWVEAIGAVAAARPDLDILTSDSYLVHDGVRVRRCYSGGWIFFTGDQPSRILERSFITSIAAVRRSRFLEVGGFDETIRWCDDWDFWIRLIRTGSRAGCVQEPLAEYTVRPDSISTRRADVLRAGLYLLGKAGADGTLEPYEQERLRLTTGEMRRELVRLEVQEALADRRPGARRRAAAVALDRDHLLRTRLKMAASALAPGAARRLLRRRSEDAWVGAGGTKVKRA
jgi:glycosyltransferase involved in cell wall biosynthesis